MQKLRDKCDDCELKIRFNKIVAEATLEAKNAQLLYLDKVRKVNETLAKYTKKLEDLDK